MADNAADNNDGMMINELRDDMERGLRFAHIALTVYQEQGSEAVAYFQALIDLLVEKNVIREEELEAPLERARKALDELVIPRVRLADIGDKYSEDQSVVVDCVSRISLCHGRCCTLKFYLTKQDLDEGAAKWDYGNPYWIRQGEDGFCVHSDSCTRLCTIHDKRPHICRKYSCRDDKRIWEDFEKRIPAPEPEPNHMMPVAMAEMTLKKANKAELAQDDTATTDETSSE